MIDTKELKELLRNELKAVCDLEGILTDLEMDNNYGKCINPEYYLMLISSYELRRSTFLKALGLSMCEREHVVFRNIKEQLKEMMEES